MRKLLIAVGLSVAGFVGSVHAQFCPGASPWVFDDVQASDSACPAITWMALNNITLGCQLLGPSDRLYCPNDFVSRKAMAAFMYRLGTIRVQEVDTGPGLTGGPITLTGTIGLTATQLLPTTACASGQLPQWNGSKWICAAAGGSGTVTSVAGGTGIVASPSPIIASGTLNLAPSYQLPQGCGNGQVPKSNGSGGWVCADSSGGGTVTSITAGAGLLGGTITSSGTIAVDPNSATLTGNYFKHGGNFFGAAPALLGNLDFGQPLEIWAAGVRVMRFEKTVNSPNVIGGFAGNTANALFGGGTTGVGGGQTIAGGGYPGSPSSCTNLLGFALGCANLTYSDFATIGGGLANQAVGYGATIAGGYGNWAGVIPPLGNATTYATVSGGHENLAAGSFSTVGGGDSNAAGGTAGTVPGGYANSAQADYSFAAGRGAIARGNGSFVWSDDTGYIFDPDGGPGGWGLYAPNNFNVRATGGVWFLTGIDGSGNPLNGAGVEVLPGNGAWQTYSDRNGKDNIEAVDPEEVLRRLVAVPVATWRWKGEDERFRHMGPMAQDFYAAYHLGANDTHIVTVDAEGVALAAIQGLYAELKERDATIAEQQTKLAKDELVVAQQQRKIANAEREIADLRERVTQVESLRGELTALRNAIAGAGKGSRVAAQAE
jgi:hypothetical protein